MIVYRDQRTRADPRLLLAQLQQDLEHLDCRTTSSHDDVVDAFMAGGVLESAVADELFPQEDGIHPLADALRRAALALGHLLWHSWHDSADRKAFWRDVALASLHAPELDHLPAAVWASVPEGYAYYGVYPEAYLEAARRFQIASASVPVVCIGLRSIGASLSAAVAGALEELGSRVRTLTLRPRGEPFSRAPVISPDLEHRLLENPSAHFLVIDEGPGISGSSLGGTARMLSRAGVPDDRIVLLPSHLTDGGQLRSAEARDRWSRHRQFSVTFEELWLENQPGALSLPIRNAEDLSAGAWRPRFYASEEEYPPVQPQHERRKYLLRDDDTGPLRLASFLGLGRRPRRKLTRARQLADAGFVAEPEQLVHGFLLRRFVAGRPVHRAEIDAGLLDTVARYVDHLGREHRAEVTVSDQDLAEMTRVNLEEELRESALPMASLASGLVGLTERPVALDGRMLPYEWIRTETGYIKVDGVDHHDDHFFPGCQDIAWDLAGAMVELDLSREAQSFLIERYRGLSADRTITARLPHYTIAYLGFRVGYCRLAGTVLRGTPDGSRFRTAADHYSRQLRRESRLVQRERSHA